MSDQTKSEFSLDQYYDRAVPFVTLESAGKAVRYYVPSRQTLWRARSLQTKEPETLAWIAGFGPGDVLIDIGANVGMYSIWAAATVGVRVIAFEPESQNYAVLNQNIVLNGLQDRVAAYCMALNASNEVGTLFVSEFLAGAACHNFGDEVDHNLKPMQASFRQGCVSRTLDSLVAEGTIPCPTHLKIDVDGIEHKVIAGADETISDDRVKSILIELNTNLDQHRDLIEKITARGYALDARQVYDALRTDSGFKSTGNYIFRR
jgi:FkbM family methyltransferase